MADATPCDSCHAGCCRAFVVPITGADALRLQRTGHDFWAFAVRWSDPDGAIAGRVAPHLYFADTGDEPFVLGLMHNESAVHPGTSRCRFLLESPPTPDAPLGRGVCSLYGSRPSACRVFPTKFDAARELVQLEPVPPSGRPSDPQPAYSLCPRPWQTHEIDVVEQPGVLAAAESEMDFFTKVATLWNRTRGPWEAFPTFLQLVYAGRVVVSNESRPLPSGGSETSDEPPATIPFRRPSPQPSDRRRAA